MYKVSIIESRSSIKVELRLSYAFYTVKSHLISSAKLL